MGLTKMKNQAMPVTTAAVMDVRMVDVGLLAQDMRLA
jgi:hypothetical protein